MRYKEICRFLGIFFFFFSLTIVPAYFIALYYHYINPEPQPYAGNAFFLSILVCLALASLCRFLGRHSSKELSRKESILVVVLVWILTALLSSLPFYFSNTLNFLDSCFEATSGITTTGATMMSPKAYVDGKEVPIHLTNVHEPNTTYTYYGTIKPTTTGLVGIEAVNKGLLFWRSFLQWIGGMGIIVIFLSILPALTVGGKYLYHLETPGPTKDTILPRIKETAKMLGKIYLALTVVEIYLLIWTNSRMPLLDAVCIAFSTLSGGGFCTRNESIGAYHSPATEWVVIVFMIIAAVNFSIYFYIVRGKLKKLLDPDFLFYLLIVFSSAILIAIVLNGTTNTLLNGETQVFTWSSSLRASFFQVASIQSTSGFITSNYDLWPFPTQLILLFLMFVGGMSGSAAGGIKTSRFFIIFKIIKNRLQAILNPDVVKKLKMGNTEIEEKTISTILTLFAVVIIVACGSTLYLTFTGIDPDTAIGVVACMMNNIGMAFRAAGPSGVFNILTPSGEVLSIILMLLGRLEFLTVLLLFLPSFWRK